MRINELVSSKAFRQRCYARIKPGYYQMSTWFNNIYSHFEIAHEELYLITAGLTLGLFITLHEIAF